jgi:hypothetical protein
LHGRRVVNAVTMRALLKISIAAGVLLAIPAWHDAPVRAQGAAAARGAASAKTWLGHNAEIEAYLRSAEIERFDDISVGVTRPKRAHLKPGGPVESLVWKRLPPGRRGGHWESYKSEIAAYEVDKMLATNMVPPVVEREVDGDPGAAVMWIGPTRTVKEMGGKLPTGAGAAHDIRKMLMFDNFIGNPDRNAGNILVDSAGNIILIDHSRAFIDKTELPSKFERVDQTLWTAIRELTPEALRERLEPLVGGRAIDAMLERRSRMQSAVDALVAKKGRSLVIIPD